MAEKALKGTKWVLDSSENFDKLMEKLGVNFALRKVASSIKNKEEWSVEGDDWSVAILSTFKEKRLKFKIGQEFDDETLDGRKVKTTFTLDGEKLVQTQVGQPHDCVITRQVCDGILVATYNIPDIPEATCVRKYTRTN